MCVFATVFSGFQNLQPSFSHYSKYNVTVHSLQFVSNVTTHILYEVIIGFFKNKSIQFLNELKLIY
jgi:hypothetical protein